MKEGPLDTADMDFTPSEIDDLETIELPSSEQPKEFWTISWENAFLRPPFPGQLLELEPPLLLSGSIPYPGSLPPMRNLPQDVDVARNYASLCLTVRGYTNRAQEPEDNPSEPQDPTSPPPGKPWLQRQRQLQDEMDSSQGREHPLPVPRRSARIASMK